MNVVSDISFNKLDSIHDVVGWLPRFSFHILEAILNQKEILEYVQWRSLSVYNKGLAWGSGVGPIPVPRTSSA